MIALARLAGHRSIPGSIGRIMPTTVEINPIRPTPDNWDQSNPLSLEFSIVVGMDPGPAPTGVDCTVDVMIYDTNSPVDYRTERAMTYTGAGGLVLASGWVGRYVTYAPDNLRDFVSPSKRFATANAYLSRSDCLIEGTPVCVLISPTGFAPTQYQWWFGVGSKLSWYLPKEQETTKISGVTLPASLSGLSGRPVLARVSDNGYKISSGGSGVVLDPLVEKMIEKMRLSPGMMEPRVVEPPDFESRYLP